MAGTFSAVISCVTQVFPVGPTRRKIAFNAVVRAGWIAFILLVTQLLPAAEAFFPIGVWLQSPTNAARYRTAGINTFVGLWEGPTAAQLSELQAAGMRVICAQNETALRHPAVTNVIAWMHGDEPDNARTPGARFGFGAPVPPEEISAAYRRMKTADATRPIFLNLGQGVAWDNWYGRGTRNRHPEDYPLYLAGCDIASFDIYPVNHPHLEVARNLWYVPLGVARLRQWVQDAKPVWNFIECTGIDRADRKPTPLEVRAEVWMSLIHGARGIVFFAHQFKPNFREAALLDDSEMLAALTALNQQITALAPVLLSAPLTNAVIPTSMNPALPIATTVRHYAGTRYIFAVAMRALSSEVRFELPGILAENFVEVLGEDRSLPVTRGSFVDQFRPWEVHLYRLRAGPPPTAF